ncbi:MAG: extracellular solute-binding protein [Provencibacterium sp.]|jgi:putative aldouronate transport system substrate-binding protein|nr:extracellular solute-binding protein [Provencibacterium sp.]
MKLKKAICTGLSAAILIAALAGCSSESPAASSSQAAPASSASAASQAAPESKPDADSNFNPEGLPILNEPETFKVVAYQVSTKVAAKDKECYLKTAEETNVYFDWVEIPQANWQEKVNIMFASSDLPDMFIGNIDVATQYEQLAVLDDYINSYAPNVLQLFEDRPEYRNILTAPDGKIHFLPGGDEAYMNQIDQQLWINRNWLEAVGADVPTTTDEFYNVLKLFKEKDPNGNGQADEIPLTFNGIWDWATGLGNLFGSFNTLETTQHIYVRDGKAVFAPAEAGYYEALKYFNKLYSEGLIDPEAFTQSLDQYNSRGKGKDIFGALMAYRAHYVLGAEHKENYVGVAPLKGPDGTQLIRANYINQMTGVQITSACKQPEVLVRWYDYINSSTEMALRWGRGLENVNWKRVTIDGKEMFGINLPVPADTNPPIERADTSFSGQTPALWMLHRDEVRSVIDPDNPAPDLKRDLIEASMPFALYGMPTGLDTVDNTQKKALLLTDIDTYLKKFVADSIMNGIDDTKWEAHLKTLSDLKTEEYTQLNQEFLDR